MLGKHSGRHAVKKRCADLGIELSRFELDRVYREVIALADRQKEVHDDDVSAIVTRVHAEHASQPA